MMRIIYQPTGRQICIISPCYCGLTLEQIGAKDVPQGVPFWIINDLPSLDVVDVSDLDVTALGKPSGFGGDNV